MFNMGFSSTGLATTINWSVIMASRVMLPVINDEHMSAKYHLG